MKTNFAALTPAQKIVWALDTWQAARDGMFIKRFIGSSDNSMIQRITELTKTDKGEKAIIQLVADLIEDGVIGDNEREGMEEAMQSYWVEIEIDQLSHSVRNKGKLADQKTVINFRKQGKDKLSYWLANRTDQLAILTLSGLSYALRNDGAPRVNSPFPDLAFATQLTPPSPNRGLMWENGALKPSDTSQIDANDTLTYKAVVDSIAWAKEHYVRPLMANGKEYYVLVLRPGSYAQLKKDPDFRDAIVNAMPRGSNNPFFTGATVTLDGAVIHDSRLVYTNRKAANGDRWGAGDVNGTRSLLCGAQALAMADLGAPDWVEKMFQYDSQKGINVDKMLGLLKPQFHSIYDGGVEDFGVLTIDHADTSG